MPPPADSTGLLDLLRKSGLLDQEPIDEFLANSPGAAALPPKDLALSMVHVGLITPFQAGHLLKGRYKNFFIGKFKVLEPLGTGGNSQGYLCEHTVMKHRGAMKRVPVREGDDPAVVARFLREARAAAALNHPHVVRAHDFDQADGRYYYLVMDYVDGVTLQDLVKRHGPLPPQTAADYIAQAADGLQHVHEAGLIHRDLKPSNLLLDREGVVRILDLGLARFTEDTGDNLTQRFHGGKAPLGTADFLSPEQAMMADQIDARADVYALGAVFYYLLAGKAPFEEYPVTQKLLAHQLHAPPPLPDVPAEITRVLEQMLAKSPADRPQSAAAVVEALSAVIGDPPPPPPDDWFPRKAPASGVTPTSEATPLPAARPTREHAPAGRPAQVVVPTAAPPAPPDVETTETPKSRPAKAKPAAKQPAVEKADGGGGGRKLVIALVAVAVVGGLAAAVVFGGLLGR